VPDGTVNVGPAGAGASNMSAGGGSAMPCGLVSKGFRAKVADAFWLPDVRLAAPAYW
jgi:hypothetical protein